MLWKSIMRVTRSLFEGTKYFAGRDGISTEMELSTRCVDTNRFLDRVNSSNVRAFRTNLRVCADEYFVREFELKFYGLKLLPVHFATFPDHRRHRFPKFRATLRAFLCFARTIGVARRVKGGGGRECCGLANRFSRFRGLAPRCRSIRMRYPPVLRAETGAIRSLFRVLNPFLRNVVPRRPISRRVEPFSLPPATPERTRRHRISAGIAHRQIGWTIYSRRDELRAAVRRLWRNSYRRRPSWRYDRN